MIPFTLLFAALLIFLLSTRQFPLWLRALIWAVGAGLLAGAAMLASGGRVDDGFARALTDALESASQPADSAIWQALWGNHETVGASVVPMLDVFLLLCVVMAGLALIALTPGETVERITRPLCIALLGAIAGGALALSIVAVGIGDYAKRRVYVGVVSEVIDGDTFRMGGEVRLRLDGIDAPESNQICFVGAEVRRCGEAAQARLRQLTSGAVVICGRRGVDPEDRPTAGAPRESYSRPLVQCWVRKGDDPQFDLAQAMAVEGHSTLWRSRLGPYSNEVALAQARRRGIWSSCTLRPDVWRDQPEMVAAFRTRRALPLDPGTVIGNCDVEAAP